MGVKRWRDPIAGHAFPPIPTFPREGGRRGKPVQKYMSQYLDVLFIHTLPVLMASRHSRASGNPGGEGQGDWMPAYAGMTFYWYRTCEMDI